MANIPCRWKVEADGVNLYEEGGRFLVNFYPMDLPVGDEEIGTDVYCEWDGADIAYRWDDGDDTPYRTYRE